MRCGRARRWMAAAFDDELGPRRRRGLDRHLARCEACRDEMAVSGRLAEALARLPATAEVPAAVEQATLRRVRVLAAEDDERWSARALWLRVLLPALATAGVVVVAALGTLRMPAGRQAERRVAERAPAAVAGRSEKRVEVADADESTRRAGHGRPPGPPPALAAAPELFVDLPLLHNMEKLEHFEAIRTTTLDDDTPGEEPQSNG
ncbi:MAG TPA: zf-HC2 domain-containing protein [Candidatus Binatia bacterium]|nr:zf-HC2 domain-containing protein [Candidatus Binatia bacterium]